MNKEIIIDKVDVNECQYALTPKKQCPNKSMPYAKETSCIVCKEKITRHNFCKNNPNCYYKQLKRKEQECETLKSQLDFAVQQKECLEQKYRELKRYLIDVFKVLDINTGQSLLGSDCIEFYAIRSSAVENKIKQYKQALDKIEKLSKNDINFKYNDKKITITKILAIIDKAKEQ